MIKGGADWRRGRVVDSSPRGPGFNPQPGAFRYDLEQLTFPQHLR